MRGMGNMQGMMKQMQKLQKEMTVAQDALNEKIFEGDAGNGVVKVAFTGDKKMKEIAIQAEAVDPEDVDMLQDLILMAVNDALTKIDSETEKTIGRYTKGIPGL